MAHATKTVAADTGSLQQHEELDLAKVHQSDRAAAAILLKYEAELKTNQTGAIKSVAVNVDPGYDGRGGPNLDDEGLAQVGKLLDVEELHIGNTRITDSGLAHLEGLSHLKVLILENTKITDAGLTHLAPLDKFEAAISRQQRHSGRQTHSQSENYRRRPREYPKTLTRLEDTLIRWNIPKSPTTVLKSCKH